METQTGQPVEPDELKRLVDVMTPAQQLRFKQAVVRQSIYFVSKRLPPEEREEARQWQIASAQAILRGEQPLPLE